MSTSSARQAEFDLADIKSLDSSADLSAAGTSGGTLNPIKLPTFNYPDAAVAASSRMAGRINAASISRKNTMLC